MKKILAAVIEFSAVVSMSACAFKCETPKGTDNTTDSSANAEVGDSEFYQYYAVAKPDGLIAEKAGFEITAEEMSVFSLAEYDDFMKQAYADEYDSIIAELKGLKSYPVSQMYIGNGFAEITLYADKSDSGAVTQESIDEQIQSAKAMAEQNLKVMYPDNEIVLTEYKGEIIESNGIQVTLITTRYTMDGKFAANMDAYFFTKSGGVQIKMEAFANSAYNRMLDMLSGISSIG